MSIDLTVEMSFCKAEFKTEVNLTIVLIYPLFTSSISNHFFRGNDKDKNHKKKKKKRKKQYES